MRCGSVRTRAAVRHRRCPRAALTRSRAREAHRRIFLTAAFCVSYGDGFVAGAAHACGVSLIENEDGLADTRQWCRDVVLEGDTD